MCSQVEAKNVLGANHDSKVMKETPNLNSNVCSLSKKKIVAYVTTDRCTEL